MTFWVKYYKQTVSMLLDSEITLALELCIRNNLSCAIVALPGSDNVEFYADTAAVPVDIDLTKEDVFFFNTYGNRWKLPLGIPKGLSAVYVIAKYGKSCGEEPKSRCSVTTESTDRGYYIESLKPLIETLRMRGGKTVISRVICGKTERSLTEIAERYFSEFPTTFRAIYFTPESGGWLVASPELLLEAKAGKVETMSLAGTRKCETTHHDWDRKNVEEHDYVTRFIAECLEDKGIAAEIGEAEAVKFGKIEHLCHRIRGEYKGKVLPLIHSLSPTPALAGEPRNAAMAEIALIERHERKCYGGYIGVHKNDTTTAYANLRCLNFSGDNYCIYAGGGITRDSVPEKEWEETENKSVYLRSLL